LIVKFSVKKTLSNSTEFLSILLKYLREIEHTGTNLLSATQDDLWWPVL